MDRFLFRWFFVILVGVVAVGCAQKSPLLPRKIPVPVSSSVNTPTYQSAVPQEDVFSRPDGMPAKREFARLPPFGDIPEKTTNSLLTNIPFSTKKMVTVVIDEMPMADLIHHVFTDILGVNYVIDSEVGDLKRTVSLKLDKEITEYQLFEAVRGVLSSYGITVYGKDNIFYLVSGEKDKRVTIGIGSRAEDIPLESGQILQLMPLKYANVDNIYTLLPRSPGLQILPDPKENLYVITGTREQVESVVRMARLLDQPSMRGKYVAKQQLTYWTAPDMAAKLREILAEEGIPVSGNPGSKGVHINPLEQWGSLIIFAAEREWLERTKFWIQNLDVPIEKIEKQFFLYFPQNSLASELGETLSSLVDVSKTSKSNKKGSGKSARTSLASGAGKNIIKTVSEEKNVQKPAETASRQVKDEGDLLDVTVTVDEFKNTLIIYATPMDYRVIENLLKQLDLMPKQIILEATIAEVTLKDDLKFGLEWYLENNYKNVKGAMGTYNKLGLGPEVFNYTYTLLDGYQHLKVLISALATENLVKILSSPKITVRDTKSAQLVVGTEVPIITSESSSSQMVTDGSSSLLRSIQYRKTGVTLEVTPTVQAKNVVTLEIVQEVSEAQTNTTSDISSPMILNRSISTEVVAGDGQTIMLGGLIKENNSETIAKIPILGDIPILKYLFSTTNVTQDRTELVLMITPHIIHNTEQIDSVRDAMFNSFQSIEFN